VSSFDSLTGDGTAVGAAAGNGHGATPFVGTGTPPHAKRPWYRGGAIVVVAAAVVVVGASVIADLPQHTSKSQQASEAATVIKAVDTGIDPCTYAVSQAFSLYQSEAAGALTATERAQVPGLMSGDEQACSFTDQSVVNLSTITLPNTPAGRDLGSVITAVYEWMTSDAAGAMNDLQLLIGDPHDARALSNLAKEERLLASDRAAADRHLQAASRALGGAHIPDPALPKLPGPGSTT
jgi:hypothetical protein